MTTSTLTFEPKFHRYVQLGDLSGWTVAVPTMGSVMSYAAKIVEEQQRIVVEGRAIVVIG